MSVVQEVFSNGRTSMELVGGSGIVPLHTTIGADFAVSGSASYSVGHNIPPIQFNEASLVNSSSYVSGIIHFDPMDVFITDVSPDEWVKGISNVPSFIDKSGHTFYGEPGVKPANPDSDCIGCFFGSNDHTKHIDGCEFLSKFEPPEGVIGIL